MNIIIIDDEKLYLQTIQGKINDWSNRNARFSSIMIYSFTSGEDALNVIKRGLQADAVFLDIEIPGEMNGLALANELHSYNEHIPLIFTTNYTEYASDGYKVNALRFLHKPVTSQSISDCMDILWKRWNLLNKNCITFETNVQTLRLPTDKIIYIEVFGHYSIITTTDDKQKYKLNMTLSKILSKLPKDMFVRIHRCSIVNLMYVRLIKGNSIFMSNNAELSISRTYRDELMKRFREFYLKG